MNFLEERIVKDGVVKEGNVLKVDSFLNHQMDIKLLDQMGAEFKRRFAKKPINKILTIEASGIGIACVAAQHFDVPVVFAKKSQSINLDGEMYVAEVESFTHKCRNPDAGRSCSYYRRFSCERMRSSGIDPDRSVRRRDSRRNRDRD